MSNRGTIAIFALTIMGIAGAAAVVCGHPEAGAATAILALLFLTALQTVTGSRDRARIRRDLRTIASRAGFSIELSEDLRRRLALDSDHNREALSGIDKAVRDHARRSRITESELSAAVGLLASRSEAVSGALEVLLLSHEELWWAHGNVGALNDQSSEGNR